MELESCVLAEHFDRVPPDVLHVAAPIRCWCFRNGRRGRFGGPTSLATDEPEFHFFVWYYFHLPTDVPFPVPGNQPYIPPPQKK